MSYSTPFAGAMEKSGKVKINQQELQALTKARTEESE